ncbi:unnamed protein product, partial [Choristocarpus tenellus]
VASFLWRLLPEGSERGGSAQRCLKRALCHLDSRWKAEVDNKRAHTFALEEVGQVDAVHCGDLYLPADSFEIVMGFVEQRDAITSTPVSKAWWRILSGLPHAEHINMVVGHSRAWEMGWQDMINQLKLICACNPRRNIRRLTLGPCVNLGSVGNLSLASGGKLTHLDFTRIKGTKHLNFRELAKQMPYLKGIALKETFYSY